ncbi:nucleoside-binding protein [Thalassoporum mexicanum PCC 7367]|uniref:BMP family lipoprotein n=1 Tax=Thalassoporum mexicanum TaxID=3457544 RepID=UPI00029F8C93|nr:BMP family ABC transporter substrate-binding protein [Pseudanabaena sp. PCC 7367]AFY69805.1 nucleoside-binding protein [Pseudanabaena sp. PCC 7367]
MQKNLFDRVRRGGQLLAIAFLFSSLAACGGNVPTTPDPTADVPEPDQNTETVSPSDQDEFKVGMVIVGPKNDAGWNQSHVEASEYVMENLPGVAFDYVDKVNPGDRPNVQGSQVADDLIANGAQMVIFNSDDFKDDALFTAQKHPDVAVIHVSGDYAWPEGKNYQEQANLSNVMLQMYYGRLIAGCAAALETKTGKIGYLGPLINDETRRLSSAAFLGAQHCWQNYRDRDAAELEFKVTWIGFWFNIPGVTLDPTKVADDFYNGGYDVVMTGIDTPEAAVQGKKAAEAGKDVKFLHYTLRSGCSLAPEICIGVPFYNWGPTYQAQIEAAKAGEFESAFVWSAPDWQDINNADTSAVGFARGEALSEENGEILDQFIQGLGDDTINLYTGALNFQDGTTYLAEDEIATPQQIWYMTQLLEGMDGASE